MKDALVPRRDARPTLQRRPVLRRRIEHHLGRQHHAALHAGRCRVAVRKRVNQRDRRHLRGREADQHRLRFDTVGDGEIEAEPLGEVAAEARHVEPDQVRGSERPDQMAAFGDEQVEEVPFRMQHRDDEIVVAVELPSEVPRQDGGARPAGLVAYQQNGLAGRIQGFPAGAQVGPGVERRRPPLQPAVMRVVDEKADLGVGDLAVEIGIDRRVERGVRPDPAALSDRGIMLGSREIADRPEPGEFPVSLGVEQLRVENPVCLGAHVRVGGPGLKSDGRAECDVAAATRAPSSPQGLDHPANRSRHPPGRGARKRRQALREIRSLAFEFGIALF